VTLSHVPRAGVGKGAMIEAKEGDWLLESDRVRIVVGGDGPGAERQLRFGAILDATVRDFAHDNLADLRPRVEIAGTEVPLRTVSVRPVLDGERPYLRLVQSSRDGRLTLMTLTTDITVHPGEPRVGLVTRIVNTTDQLVRGVAIGDRSRWPGAATFAPRLGYVKFASRSKALWLGREGRSVSYALSFLGESLETAFRFDRVGPTGQTSMERARDLPANAEREYRRALLVAAGGLHQAAAAAWQSMGVSVGGVGGVLRPVPAWATVEALDASQRVMLAVNATADGRFDLALPAGDYRLLLRSPGGEHSENVRIMANAQLESTLAPPEPARLLLRATDEWLNPLPTRWVIRGLAPTKDPDFGALERAEGAKNVVYARAGQAEAGIPAGRYRIVATHGPEHSIYTTDLAIAPGAQQTLDAQLARVVDTTGYIACDFHLHAEPSHDSSVSLEDRVLALVAEGVEFAVATDHNHVTDYGPAIERENLGGRLAATSGVEITTKTWGHFNAFPYPVGAPPPAAEAADPSEIFPAVRRVSPGAIIQVNHPRMRGVGYFNRIELDKEGGAATEGFSFEFDTIEVVNGFELTEPKTIEANIREWFSLLSSGRRHTAVGNSDSHRLVYQWPGYPRTYVKVDEDDPRQVTAARIAKALREGRAQVSTGPFVLARLDDAEPGDQVTVQGKHGRLSIVASAPDWVDVRRAEVYVNGTRVLTAPATPGKGSTRIDWRGDLSFKQDAWVVVIVRGDKLLDSVLPGTRAAPFAFTNPIFVDVDGDGRFRPIEEHPERASRPTTSGAAHPGLPSQ
jgi:hypothetical protein